MARIHLHSRRLESRHRRLDLAASIRAGHRREKPRIDGGAVEPCQAGWQLRLFAVPPDVALASQGRARNTLGFTAGYALSAGEKGEGGEAAEEVHGKN